MKNCLLYYKMGSAYFFCNMLLLFTYAKDSYTEDGILLAASSDEQARKAVELIGDCELIELTSNHDIHRFNAKVFIEAVNRLK